MIFIKPEIRRAIRRRERRRNFGQGLRNAWLYGKLVLAAGTIAGLVTFAEHKWEGRQVKKAVEFQKAFEAKPDSMIRVVDNKIPQKFPGTAGFLEALSKKTNRKIPKARILYTIASHRIGSGIETASEKVSYYHGLVGKERDPRKARVYKNELQRWQNIYDLLKAGKEINPKLWDELYMFTHDGTDPYRKLVILDAHP